MINLKYFQKYKNIGDQFSYLLASHYFGAEAIVAIGKENSKKTNLLLVGSILEWCDPLSHVCGSGLISSQAKVTHPPAQIHCLRGPLSAHFLRAQGIDSPNIYGDPGILAPELFPDTQPVKHPIGIIPHYADLDSPWVAQCKQHNIPVISPLLPAEDFFMELQQCEVILSSSLHGLIFTHAYKKPALWIEISDKVIGNGFKFFDYYLSINISPEKVLRFKVTPDSDPMGLSKHAAQGHQGKLKHSVLEAIHQSKIALMHTT